MGEGGGHSSLRVWKQFKFFPSAHTMYNLDLEEDLQEECIDLSLPNSLLEFNLIQVFKNSVSEILYKFCVPITGMSAESMICQSMI